MKRHIIIFLLILIIYTSAVNAVAIGVSKAALDFKNVLREGYAEDSLVVSTDSSEEIGIEKEVSGDIKEWVRFEPEELILSGGNPSELTIIIEPSENTANGIYTGEIRLLTTPIIQTQTGKIGSSIRTSFLIKVSVEVSGDEIIACTAGGFNIKDAEITYPLIFSASVHNDGNVRIKPDFKLDIWNQAQTELMVSKSFTYGVEVLPTTTATISREIVDINLDTGQFWADISSSLCGETGFTTFNIVEKGEIIDKGELLHVTNGLWVEIGDIVPIEAVFRNTGTRVESVKLKGTIKLAGQIIKVIDTDAIDVRPRETVTLETFFNPKMAGQYQINARVLYNNKLSYWKSSILNALPSDEFEKKMKSAAKKSWSQIALIVIVIAILLILIQIKKKRKKRRKVKFNF